MAGMHAGTEFPPIAITGMACLLPGCDSPAALWAVSLAGRDLLAEGLTEPVDPPAGPLAGLDPAFRWAQHVAEGALADAGLLPGQPGRQGLRMGGVVGAMMLPGPGLVDLAEHVWLGAAPAPDPRNAFAAGGPATLLRALYDLDAGAFALDAACASAAFALAIACQRLHDGAADAMLVAAVSHAHPLLLRQSLGAVGALSPTGRSRPFHGEGDGLVLSSGAAAVVLRPLDAALAAGDRIHAVIRGIGWGNSGRGRALLAPSERAQAEIMERALARAGLGPADLGYVECQGTGGPLADLVELRAMRRVYRGERPMPIGTLRAAMGHPVAASGMASLIRVVGALQAGVLPPTPHAEGALAEVGRAGCRLVAAAEPWSGPRRAGISSFGFGGNNAHVIVEAMACTPTGRSGRGPVPTGVLAIVGVAIDAPVGDDAPEALPQQRAILATAAAALAGVAKAPDDRWGTFVALQVDPAGSASAFGERLPNGSPPNAAGFMGRLTTLVTNRLNHAFDMKAPSCAVASGEPYAVDALHLALRALRAGEAAAVLVGGVDMAGDVARHVAETMGLVGHPADTAVAIVIKRLDDAVAAGDPLWALLPPAPPAGPARSWASARLATSLAEDRGQANAALGLLAVVTLARCCAARTHPDDGAPLGGGDWLGVVLPGFSEPGLVLQVPHGAPVFQPNL